MTLIATHLFLTFPVTVVDLENAGFEGRESTDCGGVTQTKVLVEAAGEAPVEAGPEGFLVPGSLGGEILEGGQVVVNVVSLLHLKEGEALLDDSPVLRVSEAVPEVNPEHGSRGLEVRRGLLEFTFPPLEGGALKVGTHKESLTRRVSVLLLVTEVNASALGLKCFQLFRFSSVELIWIRDGEFTVVRAPHGLAEEFGR